MRKKLTTFGIVIATFVACTGHGLVLRSEGDAGAIDAGLAPDADASFFVPDDAEAGFNVPDDADAGFNPFDVSDVGAPFDGGVGFD